MKYVLVISILVLQSLSLSSHAKETKDVSYVITSFGQAIERKDKAQFLSLFLDKGVSWVGVFSSKEFQKFSGKDGMPGKVFHSNPEDFIDWVVALEGQPKEEFKDIVINEDGEVASVYFNYAFYIGDEIQNWGAESWILVKSETGWKIQAVNFSYTSNK